MNPLDQQFAIATACGWQRSEWTDTGPYPETTQGWLHSRYGFVQLLPDYLSDLNACHEMEKVLTDEQYERFALYLGPLTTARRRMYISATAAQRSEAFLRTLGLWKD